MKTETNSLKAVFFALFGNFIIAILKFIASILTRSSGMLAEAVHSTADCANQVLLLIGNKRSKKKPDENHPFGYSREEYFWGLLVGVFLFMAGACFSIYEGIHKLYNPLTIKDTYWSFIILTFSIIIEYKSFSVAYKEFKKLTNKSFFKGIKDVYDTNVLVILMEDFAALVGLIIIFITTILSILINPIFDAIGSILVGILLVYVSYTVCNEIRKLIIGEGLSRIYRNEIKDIVKSYNIVKHINRMQSMMMGNNKFLLLISIDFEDDTIAYELEDKIEQIKLDIKQKFNNIDQIYIELKDSVRNNKL